MPSGRKDLGQAALSTIWGAWETVGSLTVRTMASLFNSGSFSPKLRRISVPWRGVVKWWSRVDKTHLCSSRGLRGLSTTFFSRTHVSGPLTNPVGQRLGVSLCWMCRSSEELMFCYFQSRNVSLSHQSAVKSTWVIQNFKGPVMVCLTSQTFVNTLCSLLYY